MFWRMSGGYNWVELFGLEIIAGRGFKKGITSDLGDAFILNESAARSIGWSSSEAIGKEFGNSPGQVVGVIKDFHFRSLRRNTEPLAVNVSPRAFRYISVKILPEDIPNTIGFLASKWKEINPGLPFEYYFYADEFDKLYQSDIKLKMIFRYFSFMAILVACLGLFGLSLFIVRQKLREICIRKVLGASAVCLPD